VPVGTFTCVVLNDDELLDVVPAADHDRRVAAAVTEKQLVRFL
jgi:5-formyltetrahydrofolate cyclo-ligase